MFVNLETANTMYCSGSAAVHSLHKSSLSDLHIACELTASRDSGTDASQANAAFTAGSTGTARRMLLYLWQAGNELSPVAKRWVKTMTMLILKCVFLELGFVRRPVVAGCACRRSNRRQAEQWGSVRRHATVRVGVVNQQRLLIVWICWSICNLLIVWKGWLFCFSNPEHW